MSDSTWRDAGLRYYALSHYFRRQFGGPVRKVSIDGGFDCPNRDGTCGRGGCIFCDPASFSPSRRGRAGSITAQIDAALRHGRRTEQVVAYFQPATNTYAPSDRLAQAYDEALVHPAIRGLIVGTRPDCLPDATLDLLAERARRTWLRVELGLQSAHDRSLAWMNRGHDYAAFLDAVNRCATRGLRVGVHVILGLPGESSADMAHTARELARLAVHAVKIHNLHAVRGTRLAQAVTAGAVRLPELSEHVRNTVDFLELLHPGCVIDRVAGDAPAAYLVGPAWALDPGAARRALDAELAGRDTWQGRLWQP